MGEYTTVKLPRPLVDLIDDIIQRYPRLGYTSRAELIKDAVRELAQKYGLIGRGSRPVRGDEALSGRSSGREERSDPRAGMRTGPDEHEVAGLPGTEPGAKGPTAKEERQEQPVLASVKPVKGLAWGGLHEEDIPDVVLRLVRQMYFGPKPIKSITIKIECEDELCEDYTHFWVEVEDVEYGPEEVIA